MTEAAQAPCTRNCNLSGTCEISCTSEKRRIAARTYRLRCHSWESSRINSRIARHGAFVLFTLSHSSRACLFFLVQKASLYVWLAPENVDVRVSMIGDHDFQAAPRLTSKTKYLIFSPEHGSGISCSRRRKPLNLVYSIVA